MFDDNLRQDHTSNQCYLPRMCLQRAMSRFPLVRVPLFDRWLVKSHGPIDARTTVERFDELEGNARPAPAVLNRFVAALPPAPPAPANGDDAVDGEEGGLLRAQPAALLPAEPGPAAGADAIVPTADEEETDGGQDNFDFPCTLCGQILHRESHGGRLDIGFRVDF